MPSLIRLFCNKRLIDTTFVWVSRFIIAIYMVIEPISLACVVAVGSQSDVINESSPAHLRRGKNAYSLAA